MTLIRADKDDGFGRDDSDWAVYREIGGDDESEAEEEDQNALESVETRLLQYDPSFTEANTLEGRIHAKHALVNAFVRGGTDDKFDPEDLAQAHQIHLNVERIRVPETWFQPGMFGIDSAGLGEVAGWVLNGFEEEERRRLMKVSHDRASATLTVWLTAVHLRHWRQCEHPQHPGQDEERADTFTSLPCSTQGSLVLGRWRSPPRGVERHGRVGPDRRRKARPLDQGRV